MAGPLGQPYANFTKYENLSCYKKYYFLNYLCDDFDHLQLINLCDTKIPTDDCFFNKNKTVIEKSLWQIGL